MTTTILSALLALTASPDPATRVDHTTFGGLVARSAGVISAWAGVGSPILQAPVTAGVEVDWGGFPAFWLGMGARMEVAYGFASGGSFATQHDLLLMPSLPFRIGILQDFHDVLSIAVLVRVGLMLDLNWATSDTAVTPADLLFGWLVLEPGFLMNVTPEGAPWLSVSVQVSVPIHLIVYSVSTILRPSWAAVSAGGGLSFAVSAAVHVVVQGHVRFGGALLPSGTGVQGDGMVGVEWRVGA